jgi:hypothetical protein
MSRIVSVSIYGSFYSRRANVVVDDKEVVMSTGSCGEAIEAEFANGAVVKSPRDADAKRGADISAQEIATSLFVAGQQGVIEKFDVVPVDEVTAILNAA